MAKTKKKNTKKVDKPVDKSIVIQGITLTESQITATVARFKESEHASRYTDQKLRDMAIVDLVRQGNAPLQ